jgi:aryl-alcohol dehydrogenase-like predicted oxidoreductase
MRRRDFLGLGLYGGAAATGLPGWAVAQPTKRYASDVVTLGNTGIKLSRLAVGTGTNGVGKSSNQTRKLGLDGLADLFWYGYDRGLRFWDSADQYGSHPHLKKALTKVPRDKVVILTKTHATTAQELRADVDRFRQEIGADYLDIVLLHAMTRRNWPELRKGAMEALAEARQKGIVRAHGCSFHSLEALKTGAATPWLQVALIRLNPVEAHMDADPQTVINVAAEMKAARKGVIGMKILAQGDLRNRVDEALAFALRQHCLDCFTIGVESRDELADLIRRIPEASLRV